MSPNNGRENFWTLEALKTPYRDFKSSIFGLEIQSTNEDIYIINNLSDLL